MTPSMTIRHLDLRIQRLTKLGIIGADLTMDRKMVICTTWKTGPLTAATMLLQKTFIYPFSREPVSSVLGRYFNKL